MACAFIAALPAAPAAAGSAAVRPDGAILVATQAWDGPYHRAVLTAILADGTIDPDFVVGWTHEGWPIFPADGDLAVLPDGSMHVLHVSYGCVPPNPYACGGASVLTRFDGRGAELGSTHLGRHDETFGGLSGSLVASGDGLLQFDNLMRADGANVRRLDSAGATLDSAMFSHEGEEALQMVSIGDGGLLVAHGGIWRFDGDLELVPEFGDGGWMSLPFLAYTAEADGDAVLAAGRDKIARVLSDGTLDPDFGTDGVATVPSAGRGLFITSLVRLADGDVLVGGTTRDADSDFVIVRLSASGVPDGDFGEAGVVTVDFEGGSDRLEDMIVLPTGEVVATGGSHHGSSQDEQRRVAVARLTSGGVLDAGFGADGRLLAAFDVRPPEIQVVEPIDYAVVDGRALQVVVRSPEPGVVPSCTVHHVTVSCDQPVVFEDVAHGYRNLVVVATDAHGNQARLHHGLRVAPRTRLDPGPASPTTAREATFTWESASHGDDGDTFDIGFSCSVDGGEWLSCESGTTLTDLADGPHTFSVRQSINRGHITELDPPTWQWRVGPAVAPVPQPIATLPLTPEPLRPMPPTLEQRREAAARDLKATPRRSRGVLARRGVAVRIASAVAATVRVTGTVKAPGAKRRRLRAFTGPIAADATTNARLKLSGSVARRLRRARGRHVTVRLRIALTDDAGVRLVTRELRARLRR